MLARAHRLNDATPDLERVETLAAAMFERASWPRARMHAHQRAKLEESVRHAVRHSSFYRDAIGELGSDFRLDELPILTKRTLMSNFDRIVTDSRLRLVDLEEHLASERAHEPFLGEYRVVATGGTTGVRAIAVYDLGAWEYALASMK